VEPLKREWLYPALDAGFFIFGSLRGCRKQNWKASSRNADE